MKNIGIIGTRKRNIRTDFIKVKDAFFEVYEDGDWIISGGCEKGGDAFAEALAEMFGIPILILHARWRHKWDGEKKNFERTFNKAAGFIRNTPIAEHSDILIACVQDDRTGGAEDTITKFKKMGKGEDLVVV
jgi:hypothetical protein